MSDKKHVTIYTRGVALPRGGGYGVLLLSDGHRKELFGGKFSASNIPIEWRKRNRRGWEIGQKTKQPLLFGGGDEP